MLVLRNTGCMYLTVLLIYYLFHCKTAVLLTELLIHYSFYCKTAVYLFIIMFFLVC